MSRLTRRSGPSFIAVCMTLFFGLPTVAAAGSAVAKTSPSASSTGTPASSIAPPGVVVKRTVSCLLYRVNVRNAPSLAAPSKVVATLPDGAGLTGAYDKTGLWFKISSGPGAGSWVTSGVLVAAPARSVNGRLNGADLTALPSWTINRSNQPTVGRVLSRPAAVAYLAMNAEFKKKFGVNLTITEAYRPLARQQLLFRSLGYPQAAVPGTSNHGLGNAVDFGIAGTNAITSKLYYGRPYDVWLTANAARWGFDRPAYMDRNGSNHEWWHYNFVG